MFPPVESQVIFLSKETPIVSVGLEPKQNGVKIRSRTNAGMTASHLCTDFPMRKRVILTS